MSSGRAIEFGVENGTIKSSAVRQDHLGCVETQVTAAREAQRDWIKKPVTLRLAVVRRLRRLIAKNAMRLAEAVQKSRGNPLAEILAGEVLPLADACRFLEREAVRLLSPRRLGARGRPLWLQGVSAEVRREPHGIVLIIGPFNYPLYLPGVQALQALVAGNGVLLKPGAEGALAAQEFSVLCHEAGFDPRLIQVLPESPEAAVSAIDAGVDKVVLTGSAETGEKVLTSLAPRLVPAALELSGCDAAFVLPNADLDLVARALRFSLTWNSGATCIAPRRVFIAKEVASALESRLLAALAEVPREPGRWKLGSKADALVRDAVRCGARPISGLGSGGDLEDLPTVLADACVKMTLLREAVLAPMLAMIPVANVEEALAADEACPFALGATVFAKETDARALAERVRAGVVVVNDVIVPTADPRLPFGGRARSGYGVTRGAEGLLEMTVVKAIAVRRGSQRPHLQNAEFTDKELVVHYIEAVHGRTLLQRYRAWGSLIAQLVRLGREGNRSKELAP